MCALVLEEYNRKFSVHVQLPCKVGPQACSIGTLIGLALPIAMIVMGAIHLDNCPAERYIPIYLIVSGSFSIILAVFRVIGTWMQDEERKEPKPIESLSGMLGLFVFAWFIAGNVWIYGTYNKYDPDNVLASNYCHNTFYLFAFWVTTVVYILIALSILICCCMCCRACCARKSEDLPT